MLLHGDNFAVAIPVDYKEHTQERPFCNQDLNPDCSCREDQENIQEISGYLQEGLLSLSEAQNLYEERLL